MISKQWLLAAGMSAVLALGVAACGCDDSSSSTSTSADSGTATDLSGKITIDGSSTVQPFAQAAAELFNEDNPDVEDHGRRRPAPAAASRSSAPARPTSPTPRGRSSRRGGRRLQEGRRHLQRGPGRQRRHRRRHQPGARDQLPDHRPAQEAVGRRARRSPTTASSATTPTPAIRSRTPRSACTGPGTDSGTFDFFTDAINGEEGLSRKDYQPSEDDNVLVQGVSGDAGRPRLLRVLLLRAEPGQAEPGLGRRRQRLRRAEHRDDPGRLATRRSRVRCSCTRRRTRSSDPEVDGVHAVRRRQLRPDRHVGADRPDDDRARPPRRRPRAQKAVG